MLPLVATGVGGTLVTTGVGGIIVTTGVGGVMVTMGVGGIFIVVGDVTIGDPVRIIGDCMGVVIGLFGIVMGTVIGGNVFTTVGLCIIVLGDGVSLVVVVGMIVGFGTGSRMNVGAQDSCVLVVSKHLHFGTMRPLLSTSVYVHSPRPKHPSGQRYN